MDLVPPALGGMDSLSSPSGAANPPLPLLSGAAGGSAADSGEDDVNSGSEWELGFLFFSQFHFSQASGVTNHPLKVIFTRGYPTHLKKCRFLQTFRGIRAA